MTDQERMQEIGECLQGKIYTWGISTANVRWMFDRLQELRARSCLTCAGKDWRFPMRECPQCKGKGYVYVDYSEVGG